MPQIELPKKQLTLEDRMAQARALLSPEEEGIPLPVQDTIKLMTGTGMWFRLSRNSKAMSCADAANKRNRGLGASGIPLHDELKTFLGKATLFDGTNIRVMAHCRGDRELDMELLEKHLDTKSPVERLNPEETAKLGIGYGIIHPLVGGRLIETGTGMRIQSPFVQVFDSGVLDHPTAPHTMMTNAGDHTWGVEFEPLKLVGSLGRYTARIVQKAPLGSERFAGRRVSILTGNSPESGMTLWQGINNHIRRLLGPNGNHGDLSLPDVVVRSLPAMGITMQLDERADQAWFLIEPAIREMLYGKPDVLTIACNTTPFFTPQIEQMIPGYSVGTELMTTPRVTLEYLFANGINNVALLGIPPVANLPEWSAFINPLEEAGIKVERPTEKAIKSIDDLAYEVKTQGVSTNKALNKLRDIFNREVTSDTVVVALTEISQLLQSAEKKPRTEKRVIDTLDLLAQSIAARLLRQDVAYI